MVVALSRGAESWHQIRIVALFKATGGDQQWRGELREPSACGGRTATSWRRRAPPSMLSQSANADRVHFKHMQLTLKRCTIRPWRLDDAESLTKHANDREVWIALRDFFPHPYRIGDAHT